MKDSFAGLGLAVAGFRPLFRAEWLVGKPTEARDLSAGDARPWPARRNLVSGRRPGLSRARDQTFRRALLEDETVGVLAGYDGERIIAGAIAN